MSDDITSHNQKGGITAKTVNINEQMNITDHKNSKLTVVEIFVVIGVIIAVLTYFGLKPKETKMDKNQNEKKTFNVASYNQQGGITAGEVNIGSLPRVFTQEVAVKLDSVLSEIKADKKKTITVICAMGDSESYNFAEQIKKYLEETGWSVRGITQAVRNKPIKGVAVYLRPDGDVDINVGNR